MRSVSTRSGRADWAVCQADCSGIGYPNAKAVININGDLADLMHYANTTGLAGDIPAVIARLLEAAETTGGLNIKAWSAA